MLSFKSDYSVEEIKQRWDEFTSPSRFAGNDDTMDLIFVSKRNGDKVRLTRRTRLKRDPFSCIFRGKIVSTESGSEIKGIFTKSVFDYLYIISAIILLFYIRYYIIERGDSPETINTLLATFSALGILLLYITRKSKRLFAEFICRITGSENDKFIPKREKK